MEKKNKQSICFLLPGWVTKHTGGAELQTYLLSEELLNRGWLVEVVTRKNKITQHSYFNDKIRYHYYQESKSYLLSYFIVLFTILRTDSFFYYIRTDARILRGALALYAYLFKRKLIHAIAGDDELLDNSYFQYQKSKKRSMKRYIKLLDAWLTDLIINFRKDKIDLILTQTKYQKDQLLINKGLSSSVIPNSYSFINHSVQIPINKKNIVLWVGNMRPIKRPEIFIELAKVINNLDWEFIMIGDPHGYESLIENNKYYINYLGSLNYKETNNWIQSAKILINTSLLEGFPNTFIQAWLNRVLVLSYKVDPDCLLIRHGLGFCAQGNFLHFTDILNMIINNYTDYNNTLDKAYRFALDEFNLKKIQTF